MTGWICEDEGAEEVINTKKVDNHHSVPSSSPVTGNDSIWLHSEIILSLFFVYSQISQNKNCVFRFRKISSIIITLTFALSGLASPWSRLWTFAPWPTRRLHRPSSRLAQTADVAAWATAESRSCKHPHLKDMMQGACLLLPSSLQQGQTDPKMSRRLFRGSYKCNCVRPA